MHSSNHHLITEALLSLIIILGLGLTIIGLATIKTLPQVLGIFTSTHPARSK